MGKMKTPAKEHTTLNRHTVTLISQRKLQGPLTVRKYVLIKNTMKMVNPLYRYVRTRSNIRSRMYIRRLLEGKA